MTIKKQLILSTILLVFTVILFANTNIDIWLEDFFYDQIAKKWIINEQNHLLNFWLYLIPKKIITAIGIIIFIAIMFNYLLPQYFKLSQPNKTNLIKILAGIIIIPSLIAFLKSVNNSYCPAQLSLYSGEFPHIPIHSFWPEEFQALSKQGKCFPAAHVVCAFAFFPACLIYRKYQILTLSFTLIYGWIIGFYQMVRGEHLISHTIASMILCYMVALIIVKSEFKN